MPRGTGRRIALGLGNLPLQDGYALSYTFQVFPVRATPQARFAVYGFSRLEGIFPLPLYLAAAPDLAEALADMTLRDAAIGLGAVHLLVHVPDPEDPVPYAQAAERLIRWHRPLLNPGLPPLGAELAIPPVRLRPATA